MRKSKLLRDRRTDPAAGPAPDLQLPDLHARSGRVGGAQVAFGAPGPRIDLDRVLESWRDGASVGGAAQPEPAPPPRPTRTVSLSDGTTISFTVAGSAITAES